MKMYMMSIMIAAYVRKTQCCLIIQRIGRATENTEVVEKSAQTAKSP